MKTCILMVGPPGSGKSTYAASLVSQDLSGNTAYVSQDNQGPEHLDVFENAIRLREDVVVDRMNFNKEQRNRYLSIARSAGYRTRIVVIHESYQTCFARAMARTGHPTIRNEKSARSALKTFFTKYERVSDDEADEVTRHWPAHPKAPAILCDLDGTMCNIDHRLQFLKKGVDADGNKLKSDWKSFFESMREDGVNLWCADLIERFSNSYNIVYCSGRPEDYRGHSEDWLNQHDLFFGHLYMRSAGDYRADDIVKEIILDFEILTRFDPYFVVDDRKRVIDMWRRRGLTALQCAEGEF